MDLENIGLLSSSIKIIDVNRHEFRVILIRDSVFSFNQMLFRAGGELDFFCFLLFFDKLAQKEKQR